MSGNKKLVPKRRFKEFQNSDAWEQRKLGDIVDFLDGQRKPLESGTRESGIYPYYGASGIIDYVKDYLFDEELILLSEDGANIIDRNYRVCFLARGKYWVNNHAHVLRSKENYSNGFICESLERLNYVQYNTGTAQPKLNQEVCRNISIFAPEYEEQKKIEMYFHNLDNLITLHQRKLKKMKALKVAYLSEMFPAEGERKPKRRFQGFTNAWEQCKLGELSSSFEYGLNAAAKEYDGENKYIRITDIDDSTHEFFTDAVTSPDTDLSVADNYKLAYGDLLFARTGASVGKSYIYKESDGLVYYAGFLIRARIKKEINPEFVFQNTLTRDYDKYIAITSQRSGQPGVNVQEYSEYKIMVPNREEQDKISKYLRNFDNLITLHQRNLEKLQNIKDAYLNEMFVGGERLL